MQWETAEEIAARALAFLAAEPARLARFLALTGLGPEDLRQQIGSPALLAAVIEHLAQDEPLLMVFAADAHLQPEEVGRALTVLQEDGRRPRRS
jgi:uncharacterized protein DUF3572